MGMAHSLVAFAGENAAQKSALSPNGAVRAEVGLRAGVPVYSVWLRGKPILESSALRLDFSEPIVGGFTSITELSENYRNSSWKPLYGERNVILERYFGITVALVEQGPLARRLNIELRAYNEGVAFRYFVPEQEKKDGWKIEREMSEFRFVAGSGAYPIYSAEQTYATQPVSIEQVKDGAHTPLTARTPKGFASILEAFVEGFPRMRLDKTADGALVSHLLGTVDRTPPFASPWRVILLGVDEGKLIENQFLVLNLNPPCAIADSAWVKPGKTISNEGSSQLKTDDLKKVVDFASGNGFKYLQLDWGWYGTEWAWSDGERDMFRKTVPEIADSTEWVSNTYADPFKVAKGLVPYRPDWKSSTYVDLDIPDLVRYCGDRGMGLCLYIEAQTTLRAHDMDKLFATYEQWGLAGLKPGFVRYGSQENTDWIRRMAAAAAKHHLWLCVHDAYVPEGMERTYPNLMIVEGGGGQEGNHPASHDVMLPFTRCLAGPFDYTPGLYTQGKSHAHMLAFLAVYYGPAQTIRGGYPAWNDSGEWGRGGDELEFLKRVPTVWDETKVLHAKIGQEIVVVRRSGGVWFLGGMTGDNACALELPLNFLDKNRSYKASIFSDDPAETNGWRPTKLETKTVAASDKLPIKMEEAGGCVAIFDPQ